MVDAGILIREAVEADRGAIVALILMGAPTNPPSRAAADEEARHPAYGPAFATILASPHNTLFVAEQLGRVVGTLQVTLIPGLINRGRGRAKLESVHVDPDLRNKGIGAVLMAHAIAFARAKGAGMVELTSNKSRPEAHRFYRRLGFDQSHEGFKLVL